VPRVRPTMHDVAALAGVSLKTVSRVVNGEPGVSAERVARVERAAAQLDYRPNLAASSLRRTDGKTATIGLLLEDVANPFSSAVHRAVEDAARRRGVAVSRRASTRTRSGSAS
jgi:LacI family transcriptional regulator